MKVLLDAHMVDQKQGGIDRYWLNLARHLPGLDEDKLKIALYVHATAEKLDKLVRNDGIFYQPWSTNGLYRIMWGFSDAIRRLGSDLIHVSNFAPVVKMIPTVTTVHDLCFQSFPETFSLKSIYAFKFFFRRSLQFSDAVICVSNAVRENLVSSFKVNPEKVFVVYHGIDPVFHSNPDKKGVSEFLRRKIGIDRDFFLIVGNIETRKNVFPVLDAFQLLLRKMPHVGLVITGSNRMGAKALQPYQTLIRNGALRMLNYADDIELNMLYNGARGLIFNSKCEGFGIPLIEGMACQVPVIANDIPVFREIAGTAALFVRGVHEIHDAMKTVLSNLSSCAERVQIGFQRSRLFSWEKTARQTLDVYRFALKVSRQKKRLLLRKQFDQNVVQIQTDLICENQCHSC